MENFMVVCVFGIITFGIYKLFELFVCKSERLKMIEKMGERIDPEWLKCQSTPMLRSYSSLTFSALKIGLLLLGVGIGLMIGFFIAQSYFSEHYLAGSRNGYIQEQVSIVYGACILCFGGLGLVAAFIVEVVLKRKEKE